MNFAYNPDTYTAFSNENKKELENFIHGKAFFAFSQNQLEEGMKKINCTDKTELCADGGGMILRKTDKTELRKISAHMNERLHAFLSDVNNFFNALVYEMFNHEFAITYDLEEAMDSFDGISFFNSLEDNKKAEYEQAILQARHYVIENTNI